MGGGFLPSQQGHHAKLKWLLDDEVLRKQFVDYVEKHGEKKGEKNMTVAQLVNHTNDVIFRVGTLTPLLDRRVSRSCIYKWLSRLNFSFQDHQKAKYKDGALNEKVLDRLFDEVLPFWAQKEKEGLMMPRRLRGRDRRKSRVLGPCLRKGARTRRRLRVYERGRRRAQHQHPLLDAHRRRAARCWASRRAVG